MFLNLQDIKVTITSPSHRKLGIKFIRDPKSIKATRVFMQREFVKLFIYIFLDLQNLFVLLLLIIYNLYYY